jgi:hypothetical protein
MMPVPSWRTAARSVVMAAVIAGGGGCSTEPSDGEPGAYRLVAVDSLTSGTIPCFASSWQYSSDALIRREDCDVALRSFEARFDSTGPTSKVVFTARVRLQDGDTAAWQVGIPATVQNNTLQYDLGAVVAPFTDEQRFITPLTGTFVGGVLTLLMPTFTGSGLRDRTEYVRQDPSVFVLTATGRPPNPSPLAAHYAGVSFSGLPADYCTAATVARPSLCFRRSFSLSASGSSWLAAYDEVVTAEGDTVGAMALMASSLAVTHPNAFVRVSSPGPGTEGTLLRFDAQGSLVGGTLTLFTTYYSLDGRPLVSPIVASAE